MDLTENKVEPDNSHLILIIRMWSDSVYSNYNVKKEDHAYMEMGNNNQ